MMPGPIIIKKCSECSGSIEQKTILSGNTIGAVYWSDGKRDAPMLPDRPWLVKCPHCRALLWIDELEVLGEVEQFSCSKMINGMRIFSLRFSDNPVYSSARLYIIPELQDYFSALKAGNLGEKKERYLRLRAWWAGNDERRGEKVKSSLSEEEKKNLISLSKILDVSDDHYRIMKAEIKRELGQFEDAEDILREPSGEEFSATESVIRKLIQNRESYVAEIKSED